MNILGVKLNGHDTCASILSNGKIVSIAEERLNRIKHSQGCFPELAIQYCLDASGLVAKDIDLVVLIRAVIDKSAGMDDQAIRYFKEKTGGRFDHARFEAINHHDAHAASAFFCSPFEEAAILVYDGSGEYFLSTQGAVVSETETFYRGKGNRFAQIHKTAHAKSARRFPYSMGIGKLYEMTSKYLGMGPYNEGKMMGLAGYGNGSLLEKYPAEKWFREYQGELVCNSNIHFPQRSLAQKASRIVPGGVFSWLYHGIRIRMMRLRDWLIRTIVTSSGERVFGDPNLFSRIELERPPRDPLRDPLPDEYYSSVAHAVQKVFERYAIELGRKLKFITDSDYLCVAGGCGLNIDANRNFLTEVGFKDLFIQPGSADCGLALGAVLYGWHMILDKPRFWVMENASLGRRYPEQEIMAALEKFSNRIIWRKSLEAEKEAAKLIADGGIIGWFSGGAEHGPRALGNRSILCDATRKDMRDVLNARVKHREMWRPFAASILEEKLEEWFDVAPNFATKFMLLAAEIPEEKRELVPSIVHVDNTCRMQTLTEKANGPYYRLVKEFEKITGVPLILNTSFNLGGEPIVETPEDAVDSFLRTNMDHLVLESFIVQKKDK